MGGTGREHPSDSSGNSAISNASAAKSAAVSAGVLSGGALDDPAFAEIAAAWPTLPLKTRDALLAIVRGT
jgi:hypothetical protein